MNSKEIIKTQAEVKSKMEKESIGSYTQIRKTDFKPKTLRRDKDHYVIIKG